MALLRRFHLKSLLGNKGEDVAVSFLKRNGFSVLERNWKNRKGRALGEIDIVAKDGEEIVFFEVKAREAGGREEAFPEESITQGKLRKLSRVGEAYIREKRLEDIPYRFDAVLIVFRGGTGEPEIRHFRSIFL